MAIIAIEGMQFYAYHGRYHEEQVIGNQFLVDVYVDKDVAAAAKSDDLTQTINYEEIYGIAREVMKKKSYLLEHVAQQIYDRVLEKFGPLTNLKVRVVKLHPAVKGTVEKVYVELEKKKEEEKKEKGN